MSALTAILVATAVPFAPSEVGTPTDLAALAGGADAVSFDPAAAGWAEHWELQLRHRSTRDEGGSGRFGTYFVAPAGGLVLSAGYEWLNVPGRWHQRGLLGVALRPSECLSVGFGYRRFRSHRDDLNGINAVDLGLVARPWRGLSVSAGFEDLNQPEVGGVRRPRSVRLGVGLRPWRAEPWLTVGAETRITRDPWETTDSRFLVDIALHGIHALVGYAVEKEELWLGASIALLGVEARAVGVPRGGASHDAPGGAGLGLALTLRGAPGENVVELSGRTVEVAVSGDLQPVRRSPFDEVPMVPEIALQLAELSRDPTVGTVVVSIGKLEVGLATISELRRSLQDLRQSGKQVVAELTNADDKAYLLAVAADRIRIDPLATLRLDGFAVTANYFAEGLSKIGVRFDSVEIGRYKSGPDALTRSEPRPEDLEVQTEVLAQADRSLVEAIVQGRGLVARRVRALLERGAFTAAEALEEGLVDEFSQPSDARQLPVTRAAGVPIDEIEHRSRYWSAPRTVAVVPVVGTIVMRSRDNVLPGDSAVAPEIVAELEAARTDRNIVGVVLRVDSGGGDVFASELIWRAVRRVQEVKPVVASFSDTAASGGYYVAAPADVILAEANTITGSIGIFSVKPDLSGLYDLVGIKPHVYKTGKHSDWSLTTRGLTEEERATMRHVLESYYDAFVARVALGRRMEESRVRELAQGRVYTGQQAMTRGLVDRLGGLADAVAEIRTRAGLDPSDELAIAIPQRSWSLEDVITVLSSASGSVLETWEDLQRRVQALDGKALALLPVIVEVEP